MAGLQGAMVELPVRADPRDAPWGSNNTSNFMAGVDPREVPALVERRERLCNEMAIKLPVLTRLLKKLDLEPRPKSARRPRAYSGEPEFTLHRGTCIVLGGEFHKMSDEEVVRACEEFHALFAQVSFNYLDADWFPWLYVTNMYPKMQAHVYHCIQSLELNQDLLRRGAVANTSDTFAGIFEGATGRNKEGFSYTSFKERFLRNKWLTECTDYNVFLASRKPFQDDALHKRWQQGMRPLVLRDLEAQGSFGYREVDFFRNPRNSVVSLFLRCVGELNALTLTNDSFFAISPPGSQDALQALVAVYSLRLQFFELQRLQNSLRASEYALHKSYDMSTEHRLKARDVCAVFVSKGTCALGELCNFAHPGLEGGCRVCGARNIAECSNELCGKHCWGPLPCAAHVHEGTDQP